MMSGHDKKFELIHSFAPSVEHSKRCLATWAAKIRIKAASVAEAGGPSDEFGAACPRQSSGSTEENRPDRW
jgi:hypothetical protein